MLTRQVDPTRFRVVTDPLGWTCRSCDTTVLATGGDRAAINRLAEAAADHGLFCGRCDD